MAAVQTSDAWTRVRSELRSQIGTDAYKNWIDPLSFVSADSGVVRLAAPTSFIGTWVSRNYGEVIQRIWADDGTAIKRLEFGVADKHCESAPAKEVAPSPSPEAVAARPSPAAEESD